MAEHIQTGTAAGGDLSGTYPNPTISPTVLAGLGGSGTATVKAIKDPCLYVPDSDMTLSGLTVESNGTMSLTDGDRILVLNQTDQTQNGIYNAHSGAWTRATDADSSSDFTSGFIVGVTFNPQFKYYVYIANPTIALTLGTDAIPFQPLVSPSFADLTGNYWDNAALGAAIASKAEVGSIGVTNLNDVHIDGIADGYVLYYDGNTGGFYFKADATGGGSYDPTTDTIHALKAGDTFTGPVGLQGTSGTMTLSSSADGGEYNIGASATGTLALFGAGANTLHLNLLDGSLYTGGTLRLSNAGVLQNAAVKPRVTAATSSATPSPNADTTDLFVLTAQAAAGAFANPSGTATDGQKLLVRVKATGAFALTYGTTYTSSGVATLPATTVSGKTISFGLMYDAVAAKWVCMAVDATGY